MWTQATDYLSEHLQGLLAIYLFGSRNSRNFNGSSDIDLAILTEHSLTPDGKVLLEHQMELSLLLNNDVDLVDLRTVPLDFKYIILSGGNRIYCRDESKCDTFEMTTYSMYQRFELERRDIVDAVKERGFIHGR